MRFSIRDMLWFTAIVAVLVVWSVDSMRLRKAVGERDGQISKLIYHLKGEGITVKLSEQGMYVEQTYWDDGQSYWYPVVPGALPP